MSYNTGGIADFSNEQNLLIDVAAITVVSSFVSFMFGVFSLQLNIFGGYDFSTVIWSLGGLEFSAALVIVLLGEAWILGTNELDGSDYESWEFGIIGFSLAAPLLFATVTEMQNLVMYHEVTQLMFWFAVSAAVTYVAYTE